MESEGEIFGQILLSGIYDGKFVQISWKWKVRYLVKYYYQAVEYLVKHFYDGKFLQISWQWKVRYLVKYHYQAVVQTFYAENTAERQPQLVRSITGPF